MVTPNRKEAEQALGRKLESPHEMPAAGRDLMRAASLDVAGITLGGDGMFHLTKDGAWGHVPTAALQVFDVSGAGDTACAGAREQIRARDAARRRTSSSLRLARCVRSCGPTG